MSAEKPEGAEVAVVPVAGSAAAAEVAAVFHICILYMPPLAGNLGC